MSEREPRFNLPPNGPENAVAGPEQAEKPPFVYYASAQGEKTEIVPKREYQSKKKNEAAPPGFVRASDDIAYAVGRSLIRFPTQEGKLFYEQQEGQEQPQLVMEILGYDEDLLAKPVYIYKLPSDSFTLKPKSGTTIHNYESSEAVRPIGEPIRIDTAQEAIERHGGIVRIRKIGVSKLGLKEQTRPTPMTETTAEARRNLELLRQQEEIARQQQREKRQKKKLEKGEAQPEKKLSPSLRSTPKQIAALNNFGVEAPPTKALSSRMLGFILHGNGASDVPRDRFDRAGFLAAIQKRWNGQKVYQIESGKKGQVLRVYPRTAEEVGDIRQKKKFLEELGDLKDNKDWIINPFIATVQWDDGARSSVVRLSTLRKEEENKNQTNEGETL